MSVPLSSLERSGQLAMKIVGSRGTKSESAGCWVLGVMGVESSFFYSVFTPLPPADCPLPTADYILFVVVVGGVAVLFN